MLIYQMLIFSEPFAEDVSELSGVMQMSMTLEFFTAYPMNRWLVSKGIKEAM